MTGLANTLRQLSLNRNRWNRLTPGAATRTQARYFPDLQLTEVMDFGSNPGALRMWTYTPQTVETSPALVVVLHGCAQSAAGYVDGAGWASLADEHGFVIVAPEQQHANNQKGCFTWFQPSDTERGRGEALSIRQMIERAARDWNVDRSRIFVTGLSAGGAMASVMLATYPEIFAAGGIIAGLPYGTASNVQEAFESMFQVRSRSSREWGDLVRGASAHAGPWPRISVWHGSADRTVQPRNAEESIKQWTDLHALPALPSAEESINGAKRRIWREGGADVIEQYIIPDMAHGTPLNGRARRPRSGKARPFFLDVGIDSSFCIARFWGITKGCSKDLPNARRLLGEAPELDTGAERDTRMPLQGRASDASWNELARTKNIEALIEKALRSAGVHRH
jgi:poly(hydroxyalkanoate) depolymerase family esterase